MRTSSFLSLLFSTVLGFLLLVASTPISALNAIPYYDSVSIGTLIRDAYPTAGISSAVALNEAGDTVGYAMIDSRFHAFVYTQAHGLDLLPALSADWPNHTAVDITDRDENGRVLIAGNALPASSTDQNRDPGNALLWEYDTTTGQTVETVDVGVLPDFSLSRINAVNNAGLAVGFSRQDVFFGAIQPMIYAHATRSLQPVNLPFTPADINNKNWVTGAVSGIDGAVRALLTPYGEVLTIDVLGHTDVASVGTVTGINDDNALAATVGFPYTDGAGRFMTGAAQYTNSAGWNIAWSSSAFDWAHDLNNAGDVVGDIGFSNAIRAALYIDALDQVFLVESLIDPPGYFVDSARDINDAGWIAGGYAGAVLLQRTGDMPPPTPPVNLTAMPHLPTWQQPWNAITLNWENTSTLTQGYFVERRVSDTDSWTEIKANWSNLQLWDTGVDLGVTYDYRVRAKGLAGFSDYSNTVTATAPSDPVDTEDPVVTITQPSASDTVFGNVSVVAEATDNIAVTYMEIETQSASLGRKTLCWANNITVLTCSWNTRKLDPGIYQLDALATDAMNNGSHHRISVEVIAKEKGSGGDTDTGGSEKGRKKCTDGIDNDADGLIDSADPDCQ